MKKDKRYPWFRSRHYLHFDRPVGKKFVLEYVTDPSRVAQHSFYPFLSFVVSTYKVKFDSKEKKLVKKPPKNRPISYAAHLDSHIYAYYSWLLSKHYEEKVEALGLNPCVLAFRSTLHKCNIHFAKDAFEEIKRRGQCHVIALDIEGFFDNLDHKKLKVAWANLLGVGELSRDHYAVFKSITCYSRVDKGAVYKSLGISHHNPKNGRDRICDPKDFRALVRAKGLIEKNLIKGIPQGSPISALLSNVYMMAFDVAVNAFVGGVGGKYMRYCDDMLLIVPVEAAESTKNFIDAEIAKICLNIQHEKTEERDFELVGGRCCTSKPFQYLGFTFDGENAYLRSASLARYSDRMNRGIKLARATMLKANQLRAERGEASKSIYRRKLYKRYSYLGRRNFVSYGYKAASEMNSDSIKKQLKPLWIRLKKTIDLA